VQCHSPLGCQIYLRLGVSIESLSGRYCFRGWPRISTSADPGSYQYPSLNSSNASAYKQHHPRTTQFAQPKLTFFPRQLDHVNTPLFEARLPTFGAGGAGEADIDSRCISQTLLLMRTHNLTVLGLKHGVPMYAHERLLHLNGLGRWYRIRWTSYHGQCQRIVYTWMSSKAELTGVNTNKATGSL
jgi:hypothetical protein